MTDEITRIEYFDDRFYKLRLSEPEREFMQACHKQVIDTVYLPSVTTILNIVSQPFLARWRGDVGNEVADHRSKLAMQKGSNIHDAIDKLWQGETLTAEKYPQDEWLQLCRFMSWHDEFKPTLRQAEHTVYSLKDLYAGTMDALTDITEGSYNVGMSKPVKLPGGTYVGDWKTGKGVSEEYFYQLAAYVVAQEERAEAAGEQITIAGAFILHLQADTKQGWKCIVRSRRELEADYETYRHIMAVWKRKNANLTPNVIEMPIELRIKKGES